jgi:Universal stress protein UspA and related nucleotide-binding proteins
MYKDILLPIDLGQKASWEKALPFAVDLARLYAARLHVMTVVPDYGFHYVAQFFPPAYETGMLDEANAKLHAFVKATVPAGMAVQHVVVHGSIYREIVRIADEIKADVIVMASHSPDVSDFVIGPNAERVLHKFARSVFIVRP